MQKWNNILFSWKKHFEKTLSNQNKKLSALYKYIWYFSSQALSDFPALYISWLDYLINKRRLYLNP